MARNADILKALCLALENEGPEVADKLVSEMVTNYPLQAANILKQATRDDEFREDYVVVTSATEINEKQKAQIECQVGKNPTYIIDAGLIGGVIIRQGETVIDNSIKARIGQLTDFIKQTKLDTGATNVGQ